MDFAEAGYAHLNQTGMIKEITRSPEAIGQAVGYALSPRSYLTDLYARIRLLRSLSPSLDSCACGPRGFLVGCVCL